MLKCINAYELKGALDKYRRMKVKKELALIGLIRQSEIKLLNLRLEACFRLRKFPFVRHI